jgi:hypothetical protein
LWTEIFMLKTALAGVLVLGAIGPSLVSAEERFESKPELGSAAQDRMMLTRAQIGHIKAALRLTREQEQYRLPVEAVLRDMTGRGAHGVTVAARARSSRSSQVAAAGVCGDAIVDDAG